MDGTARRRRRTNQALLVLVPLAVFTGLFSNTIGTDWWLDPATIHGVIAVAIAVLTPWKAPIVQRGLGRRRSSRWTSLALLFVIATTLGSGLVHATDLTRTIGPLSVMQVHIGGAVLALVLVVFHYRSHPVPIRTVDLERRSLLSGAGVLTLAAATYVAWEGALAVTGSQGADRRFTGSHERGSFEPDAMPVTQWLDDRVQHIDPEAWALTVDGSRWTFADLGELPHEDITATLDCTSAWYSQQRWTGVRLDRLVATDRGSIEVRSATGYSRRLPTSDLDRLWLATSVGGAPLSAGHGAPARLVAPGRRGFWWVKWVVEIEPSDTPAWLQLPFPIT